MEWQPFNDPTPATEPEAAVAEPAAAPEGGTEAPETPAVEPALEDAAPQSEPASPAENAPATPEVEATPALQPATVSEEPAPAPAPPPAPKAPPRRPEVVALERALEKGMAISEASALISTDYESVDDATAIRAKLREEHPEMEGDLFERFAERKMAELYPTDTGDDIDDRLAAAALKKDATAWREAKNAAKAELLEGTSETDTAAQLEPEADPAEAAMRDLLSADPTTRAIRDSGRIAVKVGDREVNVSVKEPEALVEMATAPEKFFSLFADANGAPDLARWHEVAAFAADPAAFKRAILLSGKSEASAETVAELTNPSSAAPPQAAPGNGPKSPREAMAAKIRETRFW